jgi:hypothetical protein
MSSLPVSRPLLVSSRPENPVCPRLLRLSNRSTASPVPGPADRTVDLRGGCHAPACAEQTRHRSSVGRRGEHDAEPCCLSEPPVCAVLCGRGHPLTVDSGGDPRCVLRDGRATAVSGDPDQFQLVAVKNTAVATWSNKSGKVDCSVMRRGQCGWR